MWWWCVISGIRKSVRPVKNWWSAGVVICLEWSVKCKRFARGPANCHYHLVISCFIKIKIGLTFLVLAYPGVLEKRLLNGCRLRYCCHLFSLTVTSTGPWVAVRPVGIVWLCSGDADGTAEIADGSDAVATDVGFVQSTASTLESTSDRGLLSVDGMSLFSAPSLVSAFVNSAVFHETYSSVGQLLQKKLLLQRNQIFLPWRFGLYQRPSPDWACSVLLPALTTIECGWELQVSYPKSSHLGDLVTTRPGLELLFKNVPAKQK